jgi:hypothetical protein
MSPFYLGQPAHPSRGQKWYPSAAVDRGPTSCFPDTKSTWAAATELGVRRRGYRMDPILRRLDAIQWTYSDGDPAAVAELARRIAEIGRTPEDFLVYSDLVNGVEFQLPNVNDGRPFEIVEWTDLNRAIIGCFLGNIAVESYRQGRFFASALVIGVVANQPGEGFWSLAQEVGLLRSNSEHARLQLWLEHARLARQWYASRRGRVPPPNRSLALPG